MNQLDLEKFPVCGGEDFPLWCEEQLRRDQRSARWNPRGEGRPDPAIEESGRFWAQLDTGKAVEDVHRGKKPNHTTRKRVRRLAAGSRPIKEFLNEVVRKNGERKLPSSQNIDVEGEVIKFFEVETSSRAPHVVMIGMNADGKKLQLERTFCVPQAEYDAWMDLDAYAPEDPDWSMRFSHFEINDTDYAMVESLSDEDQARLVEYGSHEFQLETVREVDNFDEWFTNSPGL
ncbi:hypothetical protein ACFL3T_01555 [Patescibacteria group bacterium]